MKECPMKMHNVDLLVLTVRKEPLMEHSGPALQEVSGASISHMCLWCLTLKYEMFDGATRGRHKIS